MQSRHKLFRQEEVCLFFATSPTPRQAGLKTDLWVLLALLFFSPSDKATDGSLQSENWALNMEICDIINETEEG